MAKKTTFLALVLGLCIVLAGCGRPAPPAGTGTITGTVYDEACGRSVMGAVVTAGGRTTKTDDNGAFTLTEVTAGSVEVAFAAPHYESGSVTVTLAKGETKNVEFHAQTSVPPAEELFESGPVLTDRGGICFYAGKLYITNATSLGSDVLVYDPTANLTGTFLAADPNYPRPAGIVSDGEGNFYVAVQQKSTILKLNSSGEAVNTYSCKVPNGLAWGPGGRLYSIGGYHGVQSIDVSSSEPAVNELDSTDVGNKSPKGIAIDTLRGRMYIPVDAAVLVFGYEAGEWSLLDTWSRNADGVAVDASGYVWLSSGLEILKCHLDGTPVLTLTPTPYTYGVFPDQQGSIYAFRFVHFDTDPKTRYKIVRYPAW